MVGSGKGPNEPGRKVLSLERIEKGILEMRGQRVILDADLAALYGVGTKRLNEQVKRNVRRFPADFAFRLTALEKAEVVAKCDHLQRLKFSATRPLAFTEHGAIMAANVLNSERAVVAPGLTVKKRLQVLQPSAEGNFYDHFDMVPSGLREKLREGRVLIRNWHALNWETEEQVARRKGVDKRGAKSDLAYVREVLGEMAAASNLLVINDEAHHAWRVPAESKVRGVAKADLEEATKWIGGLDRIHRSRGILAGCGARPAPDRCGTSGTLSASITRHR